MEQDRNLYKVQTKGCGEFYVVATSFDRAAQLVEEELDEQKYGYSGDRHVIQVQLLRTEHFFAGHRSFGDDDDIKKLIIDGPTEP